MLFRSATVKVNVGSNNQPPRVSDDTATTDMDVSVSVPVLANDSDPDGNPLTIQQVGQPSSGTAILGSNGNVIYTPGAGFVSPTSAVIIGALAGFVPFLAVAYLKKIFGYDDALDTFGVHGVGGTLGAILTGVFADEKINSVVGPLKEGLLGAQLKAVALTIVWSVVATAVIALIVKVTVGLRPTPEVESAGLDVSEHGEDGYIL